MDVSGRQLVAFVQTLPSPEALGIHQLLLYGRGLLLQQKSEALESLPPRERQIMALRYGLCGHPEMTQREVAELMGISQSYISRLEKRIILRLRGEMAKME